MAIFKCKMCGGDLDVQAGVSVVECDYCGTKQTVPAADDEKKLTLFNRANRLRMNSEFDKAAGLYEQIVAEFPNDAEAYWGLCLCNYGVEYVDDPATANKIPTIHRASFEKMRKDENYERALENADMAARLVYQDQAKEIDRIMGEVLAISQDEKPYDIFICYKETDEVGGRTVDSVIAQNIYDALTDKGYKVFFSRITLEDKLGKQYEPYIFAALNSAKVMLAVGTDYEYYNAVWVKNEWRRFWKLAAADKSKVLIPCYKDMDAYDMPNEFKGLQAQDMGKVGAMQDLIRGIDKIFDRDKKPAVQETVVVNSAAPNIAPLLERANMALEDREWNAADGFCEQVLNLDPKNARAYLGKLLAELRLRKPEELKNCAKPFDASKNYTKAMRFGDEYVTGVFENALKTIYERNEKNRLEEAFNHALSLMRAAKTENDFKNAAREFRQNPQYKNAMELAEECTEKAEVARKDAIYENALRIMNIGNAAGYESAVRLFKTIPGWKSADDKVLACQQKAKELEVEREFERLEAQRKAEEERVIRERKAEERRLEEKRRAEENRRKKERRAEEERRKEERKAEEARREEIITTAMAVAAVIVYILVRIFWWH